MIIHTYKSNFDFWISRYLRLYPVYIICILIAIIGKFLFSITGGSFANLPLIAQIYLVLTNLTIFFQDAALFLGIADDELIFVTNFRKDEYPLHNFLLIPQAWSLGLELSFYAVAPYILIRRTKFLLLLVSVSLSLKLIFLNYFYDNDPWTYRFFPFELSTFLIGSLSYRMLGKLKIITAPIFCCFAIIILITFIITYPYIQINHIIKNYIFLTVIALFVPSIFVLTQSLKWDCFLGMLSYPVYISHLIIINILNRVFPGISGGDILSTAMIYFAVVLFSIPLYLFIEKPVDNYRRRFKSC